MDTPQRNLSIVTIEDPSSAEKRNINKRCSELIDRFVANPTNSHDPFPEIHSASDSQLFNILVECCHKRKLKIDIDPVDSSTSNNRKIAIIEYPVGGAHSQGVSYLAEGLAAHNGGKVFEQRINGAIEQTNIDRDGLKSQADIQFRSYPCACANSKGEVAVTQRVSNLLRRCRRFFQRYDNLLGVIAVKMFPSQAMVLFLFIREGAVALQANAPFGVAPQVAVSFGPVGLAPAEYNAIVQEVPHLALANAAFSGTGIGQNPPCNAANRALYMARLPYVIFHGDIDGGPLLFPPYINPANDGPPANNDPNNMLYTVTYDLYTLQRIMLDGQQNQPVNITI